MKKAAIKMDEKLAGWLTQNEDGYHFVYDEAYESKPMPDLSALHYPF